MRPFYTLMFLCMALSIATALSMSVDSPSDGVYYDADAITFTVTADPMADTVSVSINDSCQAMDSDDNITWSFEDTFSDGCWSVTFNATYGNETATETVAFNVDTVTPVLAITSPTNETYSSSTTLDFSVDEANLAECVYSLDGGDNVTVDSNGTILDQNGSHHVSLWCSDMAGNTASDEEWFSLELIQENEEPTVSLSSPSGGSRHQEVTQIKFKVSDDASYADCKYRVDGGSWHQLGDIEVDVVKTVGITSVNSDGSHNVTVNCSDGSLWGWKTNAFTIDNEPPTDVTISINDGASKTTSREVTLTLHSTGASLCALSNDSSSWTDWESPINGDRDYILKKGSGTKTVYYKCKDSVDNYITVSDSIVLSLCGNGRIDDGEACDGNLVESGYTCTSDCSFKYKKTSTTNDTPVVSSPSTPPKTIEEHYTVTLQPNNENVGKALEMFFNNSAEILAFSREVPSSLQLNAELSESGGPILSLSGTYSGNQTLENLIIVFEVPKSFALDSGDISVVSSGEVTILEDDPVYAVNFKNLSPGNSFSATFAVDEVSDLEDVQSDLAEVGVLARLEGMEIPPTLQEPPVLAESLGFRATETSIEEQGTNSTENATEEPVGISLMTGAVVLGGATFVVIGLIVMTAIVLFAFFFYRPGPAKRPRRGVRL